jgi:hypothetical protein
MEAADESRRQGGKSIVLQDVYNAHLKKAKALNLF